MAIRYANDFEARDWWEKLLPRLTQYLAERSRPRPPVELDAEDRKFLRAAKGLDIHGKKLRKKGRLERIKIAPAKADDFRERYDALRKMDGVLVGVNVILGDEENYQMQFTPGTDGTVGVCFLAEQVGDRLKAELSKAGRGLWDAENDRPGPEYSAIEEATNVNHWVSLVLNGTTEQQPSMAAVSSALTNLLGVCGSPKLALASKMFPTKSESADVVNFRDTALLLALELQQPPSRQQLRKAVGWDDPDVRAFNRGDAEFLETLYRSGLRWLRTERKRKAVVSKKPVSRKR